MARSANLVPQNRRKVSADGREYGDAPRALLRRDAHSRLILQAFYDLRVAEKADARRIEREIDPLAV
jgi:hypothetical protein